MAGVLYLVPNGLASPGETSDPLLVMPASVLATAARLDYFVAENAKTARAFLKSVNQTHPLAQALQLVQIEELNVRTPQDRIAGLLSPLLAGRDGGLLSE